MKNALVRIWKGKQTLETFSLEDHQVVKIGGGIISGMVDNQPLKMKYQVTLDEDFQVQSVKIEIPGRAKSFLLLNLDQFGRWFNESNQHLPELDGCLDIDISVTPFTNTLAIKRLGMRGKEMEQLNVVYIKVPELNISRVLQEYSKISATHYHFNDLHSGFQSELWVDEDSMVTSFANHFEMVYRKETTGTGFY